MLEVIVNNKSYQIEQTPLVIVLLFLLFTYIFCYTYNTWQLYKKAGEHGWAAIIPIYNSVVFARIAQKNILLGLVLGITSIQTQPNNLFTNLISLRHR